MVGAARAVPWRVKVGGKEWLWRKHVTKQLPKSKYNELYQMKPTKYNSKFLNASDKTEEKNASLIFYKISNPNLSHII